MRFGNRLALITIVSFLSVGCDQVSKSIAKAQLSMDTTRTFFDDFLRLQLTHNDGAFLSLGSTFSDSTRTSILMLGVGLFLIGLLTYTLFNKKIEWLSIVALTLVFSGGMSNLFDRVYYGGYVVDFLNVGLGPLRTGIFNIADVAIMVGAFILFISMGHGTKSARHKISKIK
jgi:signal peptidase II